MDKVYGIIRHVLGGAGALLVGLGLSDADTVAQASTNFEAIVGAVTFFAAVGASIVAKIKAGGIFGKKDAE